MFARNEVTTLHRSGLSETCVNATRPNASEVWPMPFDTKPHEIERPHAERLSLVRELICAIRIGPIENSPADAFRVNSRR